MLKTRLNSPIKPYSFGTQNSMGKMGEIILDNWLRKNYKILDVSEVRKYQDIGIDRIVMRHDGTTVNVEYKFDIASSRTGNLFFETVSIDRNNLPGWGWQSQADYWIFLFPDMEVLVVKPGMLRNLIWQSRENIVDKEVQNSNYKTLGIPIPLSEVRKIASYSKYIGTKVV